ncbi:MAG: carbohydrate binding domain-containing protein [Chromatiales bacterium]|nr:carbohydrate binding domain-containing protein [Chromatiales bacterium]
MRKKAPLSSNALLALPLSLLALALWSSSASAANAECGFPSKLSNGTAGSYLWQSCNDGTWKFQIKGNGTDKAYSGEITTDKQFSNITRTKLETGDSVKLTSSSSVITYQLTPNSGADAFEFTLAKNASACIKPTNPQGSTISVGATSIPVKGSFDLLTLGACSDGSTAPMPTVDISPKIVEVNENGGSAELSLKLSAPYSKNVTVTYKTREGNATNAATAGDDFAVFSDSRTIPAGQTSVKISAPVVDDTLKESKERFQVYLTSAVNAELGTKLGLVDITDNDTGSTLPPPDPDNSLAQPGPYAYLNDVDPQDQLGQRRAASLTSTQELRWPKIGLADSPVSQSVEKLAKYHMIAAQNLSKIGKVQEINPDVVYLRQVNPIEFQLTVKQAMPFDGTGASTQGSNVYAGHWAYLTGTRLTQGINASTTTIKVANASEIKPGSYVVIYDAPAGSFKNAEHLFVTGVNKNTNTLTIGKRGYKSQARSHANGSIIAQHLTGGGLKANKENWVYNQSMACPRDARGNTFGEAMVEWLSQNYNRLVNGKVVDVRVDGFHFDTDRYFILAGDKIDIDNDLREDDGVDASGYNMWGEGVEKFYADLRAVMPWMIIVGGGSGSRGLDALNGVQWEGFPVEGGSFSVKPNYGDAVAQLANYGFHVRQHQAGPALTQALNKSPTKLYPYLEPSHRRSPNDPLPTSNAPFRFSFGMALLDDGFYGQPSSGDHNDVWWDEYAVDVVPGSATFGSAIATNDTDESALREHRGWMGLPLGDRVRVYDSASFGQKNSMIANGGFETNLSGWSGKNLSINADSTQGDYLEGSRALHASLPHSYDYKPAGAQVSGPMVNLKKGEEYTLAFAVKSSSPRQISVAVGGSTNQMYLVGTEWNRRVMTFKAKSTGDHRIKFQLGKEESEIWLDEVYFFKGNASVFQRDFENARIVVNATETPRTVNLGGTFQRIKGTGQDPINNGKKVQQVTVAPFDAAILVRP